MNLQVSYELAMPVPLAYHAITTVRQLPVGDHYQFMHDI